MKMNTTLWHEDLKAPEVFFCRIKPVSIDECNRLNTGDGGNILNDKGEAVAEWLYNGGLTITINKRFQVAYRPTKRRPWILHTDTERYFKTFESMVAKINAMEEVDKRYAAMLDKLEAMEATR